MHQSDGKGKSLGFVCGRCWAGVLSEERGQDVGHLEVEPVLMTDAAGRKHEFHFRYIHMPRGLEAFEVIDGVPGGYKFQLLQEDDDPSIVQRLLERMRQGLEQQHLEPCDVNPGGMRIKENTLCGRIDWDEDEQEVPCVVVDGQSLSWRQLGQMLMSFEGWQFRLEMLDPSEEA